MRDITKEQLSEILEKHRLWLRDDEGGERADLSGSDLRGSNLSYSDLRGSDLRGSNLRYSNLRGSNLSDSNLSGSNLRGSNLRGSNLSYSNLSCSNLSDSDLRGSNLRDIKIWAVTGNMGEIKSVFLDTYPITYTAEVMQIGCERHAIADWWGFTDSKIKSMDSRALVWWQKWKPVLRQLIELSPATPIERKQEIAA